MLVLRITTLVVLRYDHLSAAGLKGFVMIRATGSASYSHSAECLSEKEKTQMPNDAR